MCVLLFQFENFIMVTYWFPIKETEDSDLELIGKVKFTQVRIWRRQKTWEELFGEIYARITSSFHKKGRDVMSVSTSLASSPKILGFKVNTRGNHTHYPPVEHSRNVSNSCPRNSLKERKSSRLLWWQDRESWVCVENCTSLMVVKSSGNSGSKCGTYRGHGEHMRSLVNRSPISFPPVKWGQHLWLALADRIWQVTDITVLIMLHCVMKCWNVSPMVRQRGRDITYVVVLHCIA